MCGRFVSINLIAEWDKLLNTQTNHVRIFLPSHNVAPTEEAPILLEDKDHHRHVQLARFGMPVTLKGKTFPLINVLSEKAANREDFKHRRCVVLANGFYEWEKKSPTDKQPHYYSPNEGYFPMAAVWKKTENSMAFTILTTRANELLMPIHARMPVILGHNAIAEWLSPEADTDILKSLMEPYPSNRMQDRVVSKMVNHVKNKGGECISRYDKVNPI